MLPVYIIPTLSYLVAELLTMQEAFQCHHQDLIMVVTWTGFVLQKAAASSSPTYNKVSVSEKTMLRQENTNYFVCLNYSMKTIRQLLKQTVSLENM